MRSRPRRPNIRGAVVLLPNGFTLFNLFCGIDSIVQSSRNNFSAAAFWIVVGGFADALDGRVARATGTGSKFGEELDSLVDAVSFGLAPAMIMYFAVLNQENWEWLFVFLFASCAVTRLARFNVEQAGRPKTHFHGLPSPAAGMTLATYYWFSQTPLYNQAVILFTDNRTVATLPWHSIMRVLMVGLAFLMVSNVPYPAVPTMGWRSPRQVIGSLVILGGVAGLIFRPQQVLFPALLAYVLFGALQWVVFGLFGRKTKPSDIYFQLEPEEELAVAGVPSQAARRLTPPVGAPATTLQSDSLDGAVVHRKRRRRRGRGDGRHGDRPERGGRHDRSDRHERETGGGTGRGPQAGRPNPLPEVQAPSQTGLPSPPKEDKPQ
jgi:CDP-diacylglycerol---serine O-phosphatidyltransferase